MNNYGHRFFVTRVQYGKGVEWHIIDRITDKPVWSSVHRHRAFYSRNRLNTIGGDFIYSCA